MKNSIKYIRLDKIVLHDRSKDQTRFKKTLEIVGGVEDGLLILAIAHDNLAEDLKALLDVTKPENPKLTVFGELKTRSSDNTTYWLISDFELDDYSSVKPKPIEQFGDDRNYFEDNLRELMDGGEKIPLIFRFHEKIKINGLMRGAKKELLTICSLKTTVNSGTDIFIESKLNSKYSYRLGIVPKNSCSSIFIHPDYKPLSKIPRGSFQDINDFKEEVLNHVEKDQRTIVTIWFTDLIYFPAYSMVPVDRIDVEIVYTEISRDKGKTWEYTLNFFTKPGANTFYFSEYFPFSVVDRVTALAQPNNEFAIYSSIPGRRALRIREQKEIPTTDRISLYSLLSSRNRKTDRGENSCIMCCKPITSDSAHYIHLDIDGFILNNTDINDGHYGFYKIGPECLKKIPNDFVFDSSELSDNDVIDTVSQFEGRSSLLLFSSSSNSLRDE